MFQDRLESPRTRNPRITGPLSRKPRRRYPSHRYPEHARESFQLEILESSGPFYENLDVVIRLAVTPKTLAKPSFYQEPRIKERFNKRRNSRG